MRVLHVQLSLNHRSPSSSSVSRFLSLSIFFFTLATLPSLLYSCLPSDLPFACLSFLLLALYIHGQLCVSSPAFLLYPSHSLLSAVPLWHELNMTLIQPPEVQGVLSTSRNKANVYPGATPPWRTLLFSSITPGLSVENNFVFSNVAQLPELIVNFLAVNLCNVSSVLYLDLKGSQVADTFNTQIPTSTLTQLFSTALQREVTVTVAL